MSYTITNNIMYIRNEVGELVPVSMIASGSVKSVNNIKPDKNGNITIVDLPAVTSEDSGKFLRVSSTGEWVAESISNAEGVSF